MLGMYSIMFIYPVCKGDGLEAVPLALFKGRSTRGILKLPGSAVSIDDGS